MGRKLALVIGNSSYQDIGLAQLTAPAVDVDALVSVLRDPAIGAFDDVQPLVDESFAHTRRLIARFFDEKKRDDLLLLYFSGHGVRDEYGHLYLAVRDTERELLAATAIEASFITACMDRSASKRLVLMLDCCHSGAFGYGAKSAQGESVGTAVAFQGTGRGRVVLTATDSTEYAWQGDTVVGMAQASVFTHHVTRGLATGAADLNGDGVITVDELYDYVYDQVLNDTTKQTPGKWAFGQQGEIALARNPASTTASGAAVRDIDRSNRRARRDWFGSALALLRRQPLKVGGLVAALAVVVVLGNRVGWRSTPDINDSQTIGSQAPIQQPPVGQPEAEPETASVGPSGEGAAAEPKAVPALEPNPTGRASTSSGGATANNRPAGQPKTSAGSGAARPTTPPRTTTSPAPSVTQPEAGAPPREQPAAVNTPTPAAPPAADPNTSSPGTPPENRITRDVRPEAQIKNALNRYAEARASLDLDTLRAVWPAAPDALRRVFANLSSETVELGKCTEATVTGATATITCEERIRAVTKVGSPQSNTTRATFTLNQSGEEWTIATITRPR